jgi:hypothetical protein
MEGFGSGLAVGGLFTMLVFAILGAAITIPNWTQRVETAKTQACEALGAKADGIQEKGKGGQCVKGNTIVLRFKD